MKTLTDRLKAIIAATLVVTAPGVALADRDSTIRFDDELESCVAAVRDKLDLDGVHRIQHVVTKSSPQDLGYALTIRTSTYADGAEKEYSAYCVTIGKRKPSRLTIEEVAG